MNGTLLAISIGPVQDFIAAARRTADLHAGSQLLVKTAQTVSQWLRNQGAELIFPSDPEGDAANKILVLLPHTAHPKQTAEEAEQQAKKFLHGAWIEAAGTLPPALLDSEQAEQQIASFLEFYAAWMELEKEEEYPAVRCELDRLLAGRKALRDFAPVQGREGRNKSSLDPSREEVLLIRTEQEWKTVEHKLRLKKSERLDAVSLLKRIRGSNQTVPSTSEMAFRCFEEIAKQNCPQAWETLEQLTRGKSLQPGELIYRRDDELLNEQEKQAADAVVKDLKRGLKISEFPGYYALLQADGDRMGAAINQLESRKKHQALSSLLADFAGSVKGVVEKQQGFLIYSGGDDVLAMLPLHTALQCAHELAELFHSTVGVPLARKDLTLSAGVAVVHHLENLQTALDFVRTAEKEAKKERNSLALALHTRGGSPVLWSLPWNRNPVEQMARAGDALQKDLRGFPYELKALAAECRGVQLHNETIRREAQRILNRKEGNSAAKLTLQNLLEEFVPQYGEITGVLQSFADMLVTARFLSSYNAAKEQK